MATTTTTTTTIMRRNAAATEPAPLLGRARARSALEAAARFLRRATTRRMLSEPRLSRRRRPAATPEEMRRDWAHWKSVSMVDVVWNLFFAAVASAVLVASADEDPEMPLRLWGVGYAAQCALHVVLVCVEYRKRAAALRAHLAAAAREASDGVELASARDVETGRHRRGFDCDDDTMSTAKHLESANSMWCFIWWALGFYWVSSTGHNPNHDAPKLYWLCVSFMAFDVVLVVGCVFLACIVGLTICCCLPCLIGILYAVTDQEGASDEDIHQLPKYKFRWMGDSQKLAGEITEHCGGTMTECGSVPANEHVLSAEDARCCICLSTYDDGAELRELPCNHHFHCSCVDKWLHMNVTCPLCKYTVFKRSDDEEMEEEV